MGKGKITMKEEKGRSESLKKFHEGFCGILLFLAVFFSMGEIIARVIFHTSYDFIIDLSVWLTVWALLLIVGPLLPEGGHVSIDFLREKLRGRPRLAIELFNVLATLSYGAVITLGSILFIGRLYSQHAVFPRYFAIPMWIVELCVPIGMFIFTAYAVFELYKTVRRKW
jgi:TRAP-type C4-dicarboxylate transport system permease small subunit